MTTDPFAPQESRPSVSWKDAPVGKTVTGVVVATPELVQKRIFGSQELDTWSDGNPKMTVAVPLRIADGTEVTLWADVPSNLRAAISDAQAASGGIISAGGTLTVTFTGKVPAKNPAYKQNTYKATYTAAAAPSTDEPPF